jgi:tyrosyl-tRNA synthetase
MGSMTIDDQVALLMQGTEYGDDALQAAMAAELKQRLTEAARAGRPLRVYCGFDPRTSDLHLGHTVPMRKLRQFQELGHEVTFLIGRYTSLIGDPSDKNKLRPQLTPEETAANAKTYAQQAFKILDSKATLVKYNDAWLSKLDLATLIRLASNFTLQQFLTRENFRKRWDDGDAIYLHETFYTLMQGYDAYSLRADVQVGGTDQLFNIITAARKLMEFMGERPNIGIIVGILPGTDGVVKMSKSLGNHIPLRATPDDMYGKVMSIPDAAMGAYFRLVTRVTPGEIAAIEDGLAKGSLHPRDVKMHLAREIIAIYHGEECVATAEQAFRQVFQEQGTPEAMESFQLSPGQTVVDVLVAAGLAATRSEARRLVEHKAVRLDDQVLEEVTHVLAPHGDAVLRAGKRKFVRLIPAG